MVNLSFQTLINEVVETGRSGGGDAGAAAVSAAEGKFLVSADADAALAVTDAFCGAFNFAPKYGSSSNFAGQGIEVMKKMYYGKNGHLAVLTNKMEAAVADVQAKGYTLNMDTASYKNGRLAVVYLNEEIGGFAVHLKQR